MNIIIFNLKTSISYPCITEYLDSPIYNSVTEYEYFAYSEWNGTFTMYSI